MLKKVYTLGLLTVTTLGIISLPARADEATVQYNTQDMYLEGEGNIGKQGNQQINYNRRVNGRSRHQRGVVQDNYQGSTVVGTDNAAHQKNRQVNMTEEMNNSRHRGHKYRGYSDGD